MMKSRKSLIRALRKVVATAKTFTVYEELEIEDNLGFKLGSGRSQTDLTKALTDEQKAALIKKADEETDEENGKKYIEVELELSGSLSPAEPDVGIPSPYIEDFLIELKDPIHIDLTSHLSANAKSHLEDQLVELLLDWMKN